MTKTTLKLPGAQHHKGQNGKLLIIGGSKLFHAASLWSAQTAAHVVDMVFYASTDENNQLIRIAKNNFRDGIVIEREQIMDYAEEADVILIGPGLARVAEDKQKLAEVLERQDNLTNAQWQTDTYLMTNFMLAKFQGKKFVLDAGALQMLDCELLTSECILTPHQGELSLIKEKTKSELAQEKLGQVTILSKNIVDEVWQGQTLVTAIRGGNQGLTKGGSGDVLAGLVAGLYCYNEAITACEWSSLTIKAAADKLFTSYGPFFTTTQLASEVPGTLWRLIEGR